jgi:hypothetical protein
MATYLKVSQRLRGRPPGRPQLADGSVKWLVAVKSATQFQYLLYSEYCQIFNYSPQWPYSLYSK